MPIYRADYTLRQTYSFFIEADNEDDAEQVALCFEEEPDYVLESDPNSDDMQYDGLYPVKNQSMIPDHDLASTQQVLGELKF